MVLFCVKGYSNEEAVGLIRPTVHTDTTILTLQNGVGSGDLLAIGIRPGCGAAGRSLRGGIKGGAGVSGRAGRPLQNRVRGGPTAGPQLGRWQ